MPQLLFFELQGQVGRGGVDRVSSSDARGSGFEPRPLHLKKYHFFTRKHYFTGGWHRVQTLKKGFM